jgi:hypothetical protein
MDFTCRATLSNINFYFGELPNLKPKGTFWEKNSKKSP